METKETIRRLQLERLLKLSGTWAKMANELELYEALFATSIWQKAHRIGVTISSSIEIDTKPIILQARLQSKEVYVPRTLPNRQMSFFKLKRNTVIEKNSFGIYEPQIDAELVQKEELDLLLVPGLAFSLQGDRIGFGGGYYDRYLADYRGVSVSLVDPQRLFEECAWKKEETDQQINKIVTVGSGVLNGIMDA